MPANLKVVSETAKHIVERTHAREEQCLAMLLAGKSLADICEQVPISRSSLWRLRRCEKFQARLKAARAHAFEGMVSSLHSSATVFAETLKDVCQSPTSRGSEKATAARSGLDSLFKAVEVFDFAERIARLEVLAKKEAPLNDSLKALDEQAARHYRKEQDTFESGRGSE